MTDPKALGLKAIFSINTVKENTGINERILGTKGQPGILFMSIIFCKEKGGTCHPKGK